MCKCHSLPSAELFIENIASTCFMGHNAPAQLSSPPIQRRMLSGNPFFCSASSHFAHQCCFLVFSGTAHTKIRETLPQIQTVWCSLSFHQFTMIRDDIWMCVYGLSLYTLERISREITGTGFNCPFVPTLINWLKSEFEILEHAKYLSTLHNGY